jgi:EAL domain-containing protein (putative c-di-GMP-specific phosphodiesterase class I)
MQLKFSANRTTYLSDPRSHCATCEFNIMQRLVSSSASPAAADDNLMNFLHRAPLGLVHLAPDGAVAAINPMAASLLMPLSPAGRLKNLFAALSEIAPQLQRLASDFPAVSGTVCEAVRVPLIGQPNSRVAQNLFIGLFKLNATRFVATVSEANVDSVRQNRTASRNGLEGELRQALEDKQLFVQYQPVVSLRREGSSLGATDRSAGVEALVRWNHRIRGAVSPLEFIGVAEECGLIGALSDFVLDTACRQFVRWQTELGASAPRRLAVNLSCGQLAHPRFVATVRDILAANDMMPSQLQLEVNESLAARDEAVQARLRALKDLGLTLALDNFGTAQSSLANLHRLPVDLVKIDRSIVSEAVDNAHTRVLIDATVRVASSLHMRTAAEGIETEAQLAVVRQLGCDSGQGFFFSEAVSPANLAQWLALDPVESLETLD